MMMMMMMNTNLHLPYTTHYYCLTFCVFDSSLSDITQIVWYRSCHKLLQIVTNQTVCNNLWHDSLCLYFVSKAIREQICWTNWFEECQQRLSLPIALPTLTVGEETHFQPQSVASFCRSLIGFLPISASVCQNICVICSKTVPFIFSKCVVWGLAELTMVIGLMWSKYQTNST